MKTILVLTLSFIINNPTQEEDKLLGTWNFPKDKLAIKMVKNGDIYEGTAVKAPAEQAIGKVLLQDFKKEGNVWKGKFYVIPKDRLLDATLILKEDGSLEMEIDAGRKTNKIVLTRSE